MNTAEGGKKVSAFFKKKYGVDEEGKSIFHKRVGALGGRGSANGGFASNKIGPDGLTGRERARIAGRVGGLKSVRRPKVG